jgi:hypothetical protein
MSAAGRAHSRPHARCCAPLPSRGSTAAHGPRAAAPTATNSAGCGGQGPIKRLAHAPATSAWPDAASCPDLWLVVMGDGPAAASARGGQWGSASGRWDATGSLRMRARPRVGRAVARRAWGARPGAGLGWTRFSAKFFTRPSAVCTAAPPTRFGCPAPASPPGHTKLCGAASRPGGAAAALVPGPLPHPYPTRTHSPAPAHPTSSTNRKGYKCALLQYAGQG